MHNKNYQSYKLKRTVEGVIIYEAKGIIFYFSKPSRKVADYITKKLYTSWIMTSTRLHTYST